MKKLLALVAIPLTVAAAFAAGAGDTGNDWKPIPRRLPTAYKPASEALRAQITPELEKQEARIAALRKKPELAEFLVDAEVYVKSVRFALDLEEFFGGEDPMKYLATAAKRLDALEKGEHPFYNQTGQTVVGYRSYIDNSAQPFEIDVPKKYDASKPWPLYIWLHGRGDNDTDIHFIRGNEGAHGPYAPDTAISIHAFGRNCLGFKAAGEVDILECIASAKKRFNIDPDRVVLAGFSMGGGGAWSVGGHYTDQFAVVHAGAGYVDVVKFMKVPKEKYPTWYEQKLWGVHDMPDYVRNYFNTTTIGYGGDQDGQREAAEIMDAAFKAEGRDMTHIIGKNMGHGYTGEAMKTIEGLIKEGVDKGRDWYAKEVFLQTRTLRYDRMKWVTATALKKHWEDSRIDAKVVDDTHIVIATKNIAAFQLSAPWPADKAGAERDIEVKIDDMPIKMTLGELQKGVKFYTADGHLAPFPKGESQNLGPTWFAGSNPAAGLIKTHGLTGPIDDAFMDSFLVVVPTSKCASPVVQKWVDFELAHQLRRWRDVFRADLPTKKDTEITKEDIAKYNLICWGDESANSIIKQAADRLPIRRQGDNIAIGEKSFPAATHIPLLIYPNPLNPAKYIVLNSCATFREEDDGNNSRQNPKLPDWAILDATVQPDAKSIGKVVDADFFTESWQVAPHAKP